MAEQRVFRTNKKVFIMNVISSIILCFILIGIPFLIMFILRYLYTSITVSENGLLYKKGWLNTTQKQIPYNKINTVDLKMGLLGKMWDYGEVRIFTGNDVEGIAFKNIDRPKELKSLIEAKI